MLSQREHSVEQLTQKLTKKGYSRGEITTAISLCQQQNYQSDERFTQQFVNMKVNKGYGPLVIRQQLNQHGIKPGIVAEFIQHSDEFWVKQAKQVWNKKYQRQGTNAKEIASQKRFLYYRGFEMAHINQVLN